MEYIIGNNFDLRETRFEKLTWNIRIHSLLQQINGSLKLEL